MTDVTTTGSGDAGGGGSGSQQQQERRDRRRVGALLNTYYSIDTGSASGNASGGGEGDATSEKSAATIKHEDPQLDRQGFDAKRYFDGVVSSRQLSDIVQRKNELDSEVKDIDADMQTLVYENYSKFIRATDVIKDMKCAIDGLKPDLNRLRGSMTRLSDFEGRCEKGVSNRAGQMEALMKQQSVCKKLKLLFELPSTIRSCLDRQEHRRAIAAYRCCADFLQRYRHINTFQKVSEEVDEQMGRIRMSLEQRIASNELAAEDAVESALMLIDLGEDDKKVARDYLNGRRAVLRRSLHRCFSEPEPPPGCDVASTFEPATSSKEQRDLKRPASVALHGACTRATNQHVPALCDAVEGFQMVQERKSGQAARDEEELTQFVSGQVEDLCERISAMVESGRCVPTQVLVSCINSVRDALRRLHALLPQLLKRLFTAFLGRITNNAMRSLFSDATSALVSELCRLHGECRRLEEANSSGREDVLEEIAKMEQCFIMHILTALSECQPLLTLLGTDRAAGEQLVRGLQERLICFFLTFVEACHLFVGSEATEAYNADPSLPVLPQVAAAELEEIAALQWSDLFGLALVRIGRHLEVKAINQVWGVAKDLFTGCSSAASELMPNQAVIKATRGAAKTVITNYALVGGQHLARVLRDSLRGVKWMSVREPRDPRPVVEIVLRKAYAFDAQLALVLGDPRKPPSADSRRRVLNQRKTSMELEIEREWAKKLQVFAPVPFNRNGVILGVLRIAFKAFYEDVREETFGKFGLQQIQVDCAFLAEVVRDFVEAEDAGVLDSLLDEVVTSASQRCIDPVLMDVEMLGNLCDDRKRCLRLEG